MRKHALSATAAALMLATAGIATAQTSPSGSGIGTGSSSTENQSTSPGLDNNTRSSPELNSSGSGSSSTSSSTMGAISSGSFSTDLKGKDLVGPDGNKIGNIEDLVGDKLIVGVGGFLGIGERKVALSRDQIAVSGSGGDLKATTSLTRDEVKALPEYAGSGSGSSSSSSGPLSRPLSTMPSGGASGTGTSR